MDLTGNCNWDNWHFHPSTHKHTWTEKWKPFQGFVTGCAAPENSMWKLCICRVRCTKVFSVGGWG